MILFKKMWQEEKGANPQPLVVICRCVRTNKEFIGLSVFIEDLFASSKPLYKINARIAWRYRIVTVKLKHQERSF